MREFDFKGITINAINKPEQILFMDDKEQLRPKYRRRVEVVVAFWNFVIRDDLYKFAFVKSVLNYFMQAYWKRSTKEGNRIFLEETLVREGDKATPKLSLYFKGRQKGKTNYLYICLCRDGGETLNEIYLSGREVLMFDIAMGKVISMLQPSDLESMTINGELSK